MLIQNVYSSFTYDDFKVECWRRLLEQTPFELARKNLERYCLNPENAFPPHPGALAEKPIQSVDGRYIPNVEETRAYLDQLEERYRLTSGQPGCPAHLKEKLPWNIQ